MIEGKPTEGKPAYVAHLGGRLRDLRRQTRQTQAGLSRELDVAENTYAAWERGDLAPRLRKLVQIADRYDVSLDYLLGRGEAAPQGEQAGGIVWRLAWSRPSKDRLSAAAIWRRLVAGEAVRAIADDVNIDRAELETLVQDLVLSESLTVEGVQTNEPLESQVRQRFKDAEGRPLLRHVSVANLSHIGWDLVRYVLLGYQAKEYFRGIVRPGTAVGLCGGFAVSRMVHALQRGDLKGGIRVFPIAVTPVFEQAGVSANGAVSALAYRHFDYGVQASELPFLFEELSKDPVSPPFRIARRILDDAARVDFVFMGIGSRETGALARDLTDLRRDYQWLGGVDTEIEEMRREGTAIGNILYHLVDDRGEPVPGFAARNAQLVCSIGLDGLRDLVDNGKRVVVIASGREKADVTRAAILGRYVNALIVDDDLAWALIAAR